VTLASKRKMSQRQKTSRSSRSTQTDHGGGGGGGSGSSWSLLDAPPVDGDLSPSFSASGGSSELMMPVPPRPGTASSSTSSCCAPAATTTTTATACDSDSTQLVNGEFYEDTATLFDKLVKAEEVRRSVVPRVACWLFGVVVASSLVASTKLLYTLVLRWVTDRLRSRTPPWYVN